MMITGHELKSLPTMDGWESCCSFDMLATCGGLPSVVKKGNIRIEVVGLLKYFSPSPKAQMVTCSLDIIFH